MRGWDHLTTTALLGIERGSTGAGAPAAALDLLDAAAALAPLRRSAPPRGEPAAVPPPGGTPARTSTAPAPSPEERLPAPPAVAVTRLASIRSGVGGSLVEWLHLARDAGCRVPERDLTYLLDQAVAHHGVRTALVPVLGERGRWLARQHPGWAALLAERPSLPADADLEQVWAEGSPEERHAVFARWRATDPSRAREVLTRGWKKEKADDRQAFVGLLGVGLGLQDEDLLVRASQDRRRTTQHRAIGLLRTVPGTAVNRRARERALAAVRYERHPVRGRTLVVEPPAEFDASMEADLMWREPTERRWSPREHWLTQIVTAVPLSHWTDLVGVGADEVLALAVTPEWEAALRFGWSFAVFGQRDPSWVEALVRRGENKHPRGRLDAVDLLGHEHRQRLAAEVFRQDSTLPGRAGSSVVIRCPGPWGPDLTREVLLWLVRISVGTGATAEALRGQRFLLSAAAREMDVRFLPAVRAIAETFPADSPWRPHLDEALAVLTTRTEMLEEFS